MRITALDEPMFTSALEAGETLFKFMADKVGGADPGAKFATGGAMCLRPSVAMLTSLDMFPGAVPVDFPPLENPVPVDAVTRGGRGNFIFSSENEVLFLKDGLTDDGYRSYLSFLARC